MRLFRHESDLPADAHGAVVTLGNFDGVHLGHQAVIGEAARLFPERALWLAGFSFGAYVAMRALRHAEAARLITVAPPVHLYDCADLPAPHCPWLLIQGRDDEVVPCKEVMRWASRRYPAPRAVYLDGVGHYFHGRLATLRAVIGAELDEYRPLAQTAAG